MTRKAGERISARVARELLKAPKRSKYRNKHVVVDGIRFDSQREATRWHVLRLMERSGDIKALIRQPRYPLMVGTEKIGEYVADMEYLDAVSGQVITEDVKSEATERIALFQWKRKHFEAQYRRKIRVTR